MTIVVTVIHVLVCFSLIAVILLQAGRGQGLGTSFGSGEGTQSIFGTRSADFFSKATTVAAILFLATSITLDVLGLKKSQSLFDTVAPVSAEDLEALKEALAELDQGDAVDGTEEAGFVEAIGATGDGVSDTDPWAAQETETVWVESEISREDTWETSESTF